MAFMVTLAYELHPQTEPDAARLFRAELVGRRWQDRYEGDKMPAGALWIRKSGDTTDTVYAACADDLRKAAAAVAGMGKKIALLRAWVQVTGAGTFGLVPGLAPGSSGSGPQPSGTAK
jgi:hypothetical protein